MDISFETPFHTLTRYEKIEDIKFYYQFHNWVKGEFDLYLMEELEELEELIVHFPSGLFSVKLYLENEKDFSIEIKIISKTLKIANQISCKIESIQNHLKKVLFNSTTTDES
jgi:hypothetical protein